MLLPGRRQETDRLPRPFSEAAFRMISLRRSRRPYLTASVAMNETLSADDPYARAAQIFPKLPAELIARVAAYGAEELIRPSQTLFHRGERRADFFLLW